MVVWPARRVDEHHLRHADDAGDRHDVAHEIEAGPRVERGVDRVGLGGEEQRMAVRRCIHDRFRADVAVARGGSRSRPPLRAWSRATGHQPGGDVDAAAGRKADDDAQRPAADAARYCEKCRGRSAGKPSCARTGQSIAATARPSNRRREGSTRWAPSRLGFSRGWILSGSGVPRRMRDIGGMAVRTRGQELPVPRFTSSRSPAPP